VSKSTRQRRSSTEIQEIKSLAYQIAERYRPVSVRQVFYQLVSRDVIPKTQNEYRKVSSYLTQMRRVGELPYEWIADVTRWVRRPATHAGMTAALDLTAATYRRSLWAEQDINIELWCESNAVAGVLGEVTNQWDISLFPVVGYASATFLYSAGQYTKAAGKPTKIYYFGDHDSSGTDIERVIRRDLPKMVGSGIELEFERVAVTLEQIERWDLPSQPPKRSDPRGKSFKGESTEIEAIAPDTLRELASDAITGHLPAEEYKRLIRIEAAERKALQLLSPVFGSVYSDRTGQYVKRDRSAPEIYDAVIESLSDHVAVLETERTLRYG